jgi:hypothetical protein
MSVDPYMRGRLDVLKGGRHLGKMVVDLGA